ncbi:MAG: ABC transporter ATP-binding protein [Bacteroidia bacterium]
MSNRISHSLSLQNLSVGYGQPLLQNVSFSVSDFAGVIGLIGNNGKGKTTLLKTISGLHEPLSGKIMFDEKNISELTMFGRARVISMGLSSAYVSFPVTAYELISMGRYPYNNHWAKLTLQDKQIIASAVELCGIEKLQNKPVTSLSDGERQKVFIAKTIAQQTPLILFDEPTAFLDYSSKKQFFQSMKALAEEEGRIILISSHDIDFLTAYTDNLLMIGDDGDVLFDLTHEIIETNYFNTHFTRK